MKKAFDYRIVFTMSTLAMLLASCSAQLGVPTAGERDRDEANKVTETPSLDGEWVSTCIRETSFTSLQYRLKYGLDQVERRTDRYPESASCQGRQANGPAVKSTYRAIRQYGSGHFQLEYRTATETKYQFVRSVGESLWTGPEHFVRDLASDATIEMKRALSLPPHTGPANLATDWRNARFAFCSNQGYATLIDLSRSDLQEGLIRAPRAKVWSCHHQPATDWRSLDAGRLTGSRDNFELKLTGFTEIFINHSGYSGTYKQFPYGYSNIGGNSGECFFLQDDNVRGLNLNPACE